MDGDRSPGPGCVYIGDKGAIELNRNMYTCDPVDLVNPADRPTPLGVPETHPHVENWLECIKSRGPARRYRIWPAQLDAVLPGEHCAGCRQGSGDATVGSEERAIPEPPRGECHVVAPAPCGV